MKRGIIVFLAASVVGAASAAEWTDNVKVKGDLRYRHEVLDRNSDTSPARNRQRLRARLAIEGRVSETAKVVVGLASGSDDPVSTNQTLGESFTTKNLGLDLASLMYRPARLSFLTLTAGKMEKPFIIPGHSELQWDGDLNPEGAAAALEHNFEKLTLAAVVSGLWIQERSKTKDSWLGSGQVSARLSLNEDKSGLLVGAGYFDYQNIKGFPLFYDEEDAFGNSAVEAQFGGETVNVYAHDYNIVEAFVELTHPLGAVPAALFGHYVNNIEADSLNAGWSLGASAGKIKNPGSWTVRYVYRELEADAGIGAYTDSDLGEGGANASGHEVSAACQVAGNTTFSATYFYNTIGIGASDKAEYLNRLQVDLQLKF
ncbi:MAG TPA: putative porin [candidate division Zixibacteria bacterium]|nr:putative porin [candidate division Zixibacteria bacterium]